MIKILNALAALFSRRSSATNAEIVEPVSMQSAQVGRVTLDVPSTLEWKMDKGVLMGQSPGTYDVMMSVSVYSAVKDGALVAGAGPNVVTALARTVGVGIERDDSRVWYRKDQPAPVNTPHGASIHDCVFGFEAHSVTITCVIDREAANSQQARGTLASVPQMMRSAHTTP